jgi:hypothetical protein
LQPGEYCSFRREPSAGFPAAASSPASSSHEPGIQALLSMDYHAALDTRVKPEYDETQSTALVSKAQRLFLGVALAL